MKDVPFDLQRQGGSWSSLRQCYSYSGASMLKGKVPSSGS